MKKPTIFIFTNYYLPGFKAGGPIKSIANLVKNLKKDFNFKIATTNYDFGEKKPYENINKNNWSKKNEADIFYMDKKKISIKRILSLLKTTKYDIIYLNGFFATYSSIYPLIANLFNKKNKKPIILAPRGEFSKGALSLKSYKKKFFINIVKFLRLHRNVIFQASSNYEADDIRRVLGSCVDIQIAENIASQEFATKFNTRLSSSLNIVFISRISPKKNLLLALEVLRKVHQPLTFDIYGPIEDTEYWQQCEAIIKTLPPHIQVNYKGNLKPENVVNTLKNYDVFFFPTKGENYGHVIAEALCAGLPILIADTTPWRNLQELGIGWDLSLNNPDAFSSVLDKLATMPPEEHLTMRQNVLAWAKKKFSQRDAIEANLALFKYAYQKK